MVKKIFANLLEGGSANFLPILLPIKLRIPGITLSGLTILNRIRYYNSPLTPSANTNGYSHSYGDGSS